MRLGGTWKAEFSLVLAGALLVAYLQAYRPQKSLKESIVFDFNDAVVSYSTDFLKLTSFGYSRAMSSLLWLRFLQQTPPQSIGSDQLSWIYFDLNSVTELDPDFLPAYQHGGIFLSVVTEDKRGAEQIFLKGVKRFPDDWRIRAYLAYHYQFELGEKEKAANQYVAAAGLPGAPYLVKVLAGSAVAKKAGNGPAIELLQEFLKNAADPESERRIRAKIAALKGEKN